MPVIRPELHRLIISLSILGITSIALAIYAFAFFGHVAKGLRPTLLDELVLLATTITVSLYATNTFSQYIIYRRLSSTSPSLTSLPTLTTTSTTTTTNFPASFTGSTGPLALLHTPSSTPTSSPLVGTTKSTSTSTSPFSSPSPSSKQVGPGKGRRLSDYTSPSRRGVGLMMGFRRGEEGAGLGLGGDVGGFREKIGV